MGHMKRTATIWTLLILLLAYYFYTPMPSNAREPIKQRFTAAAVRAIKDLSYLGYALGLGSEVNISRTLTELNQYLSIEEDDGSIEVDDEIFAGVKVRVYTPMTATKRSPGLVYLHGGGFALLSVATYDAFCRQLVKATNIVVVSVEYRRSPEFVYPTPLEDCVKATKFFIDFAEDYGVDPSRIGVAGDSAGGNLAMATSMKLKKEPGMKHSLKTSVLLYPLLQALDMNLPSYIENDLYRGPSFCTKNTLIFYIQLYAFGKISMFEEFRNNTHIPDSVRQKFTKYVNRDLLPAKFRSTPIPKKQISTVKEEDIKVLTDPYFSPLLASDEVLSTLPPIYIMTCDFDALRDDGTMLAERLKNIGHDVKHVHMDGLEHGFAVLHFYENTKPYITDLANYIVRKL